MWKKVTKTKFFAVIGPQNVSPSPERMETFWKTPEGRVIGRSTPGYLCQDADGKYNPEHTYYLPA